MQLTRYHLRIIPLKLTVNQSRVHSIHPLNQFRLKLSSSSQIHAQLKSWTYAGTHHGIIHFQKQSLDINLTELQKRNQHVLTLVQIDHKVQRSGDTFIHKVQKEQVVGETILPIEDYIDKFQDFNAHYFEQKLKLSHEFSVHVLIYIDNSVEGIGRMMDEHEKQRVFNLLNQKPDAKQNVQVKQKNMNRLKLINERDEHEAEQTENGDQGMNVGRRVSSPLDNQGCQSSQEQTPFGLRTEELFNPRKESKTKLKRKDTFFNLILKMVMPNKHSDPPQNQTDSQHCPGHSIQDDNPQNQAEFQEHQQLKQVYQQLQVLEPDEQLAESQIRARKVDIFLERPYAKYLKEETSPKLKKELMRNAIKQKIQFFEAKRKAKLQKTMHEEAFEYENEQKGWNKLILYVVGFVLMFLLVIFVQVTEFSEEQPVTEVQEEVHKYMEEEQLKYMEEEQLKYMGEEQLKYMEEEQLKVKIMAKVKYDNKKVRVKRQGVSPSVTFTFKR